MSTPLSSINWGLNTELEKHIGKVLGIESPFQGESYHTWMVNSKLGRFVLKTPKRSDTHAEVVSEYRVLGLLPLGSSLELPTPIALFNFEDQPYSLQTCLEGQNLVQALAQATEVEKHRLAASFGEALRELHRWKPALEHSEAPGQTLAATLTRQTAPDTIISMGIFKGCSYQAVMDELEAGYSGISPQMVFTHWDYCVPNAMVRKDKVTGIVDWATARYADYRTDLAAAAWSLEYNLGSRAHLPSFLDGYCYAGTLEELRWFEGLWVLP